MSVCNCRPSLLKLELPPASDRIRQRAPRQAARYGSETEQSVRHPAPVSGKANCLSCTWEMTAQ